MCSEAHLMNVGDLNFFTPYECNLNTDVLVGLYCVIFPASLVGVYLSFQHFYHVTLQRYLTGRVTSPNKRFEFKKLELFLIASVLTEIFYVVVAALKVSNVRTHIIGMSDAVTWLFSIGLCFFFLSNAIFADIYMNLLIKQSKLLGRKKEKGAAKVIHFQVAFVLAIGLISGCIQPIVGMYQHVNQEPTLFIRLFLFQIGIVLICVGLLSPFVLNALMGDISNAIQTIAGSGQTNDPQNERRKKKLTQVLEGFVRLRLLLFLLPLFSGVTALVMGSVPLLYQTGIVYCVPIFVFLSIFALIIEATIANGQILQKRFARSQSSALQESNSKDISDKRRATKKDSKVVELNAAMNNVALSPFSTGSVTMKPE